MFCLGVKVEQDSPLLGKNSGENLGNVEMGGERSRNYTIGRQKKKREREALWRAMDEKVSPTIFYSVSNSYIYIYKCKCS